MIDYLRRRSTPPTDLVGIIRHVRARWRMKLALRGAVALLATAFLLLLAAAYGMEWARFSGVSIITSRVLLGVALVAAVAWFLVRPLRWRVTDEQVALYLEEHEPSLQATLVSAVEASRAGHPSHSPALVQRLVEQAIERCLALDTHRRIEQTRLQRYAMLFAGIAVVAMVVVGFGPAFVRQALTAVFLISRSVEAAAPYRIDVAPGNTTVPKGADQTITARLHGFAAEDATLMMRKSATAVFESLPLIRAEDGRYEGMLFDVAGQMEYFVEAAGVRSPVFTLKVVDLPYVQRLEMEYRFPAYTGLEPQQIEDGGDIAVLRGTEVRLRVHPTMKAPGGRVALNDKDSIALTVEADGALTAGFTADRNGFYRIELDAPTGERVAASPQYTIDVLTDQAPTVSFSKPGRDTSASAIEEVFVEASAEDDFGIRDLELVYSVNGGPEKTVKLFAGRNRLAEVTAGHTFYLEELDVQVGDSVSYYARATDNDAHGGKPAMSDLYFLRVRPFKKDFRQAQSAGGGGGGGGAGAGGQVDALSEQQRQIIAATFNVQRDRKTLSKEKLRENTTVVALSQARLREQVDGLVTRMNSRLVEPDPAFKKIAELLPQAIKEMQAAEEKLKGVNPEAALPPEHRALQFLQKAEEEYETQVSAQNGGGGGGGGQQSALAQELADLFELELDRLANQYETADRAMQQNADQQIDELLEKLKELARRQEQEAERLRRLQAMNSGSSGSAGAQQRQLAEQVEEAARRLERLAREENRPDLMESARQMQQAADAMRRAAGSGDAGASAQAQAALERLKETERRLQRSVKDRAERDIRDLTEQADKLARDQQEIANAVRGLPSTGPARAQQTRQLNERKDALEAGVRSLEQQLDRAAADASREERQASRKLSEAAGAIRDNRIGDRIRYSKAIMNRNATAEAMQAAEGDISRSLDQVRDKLGEASASLGQGKPPDSMADALERARRLARGMESLEQRTRERAQQNGQQGSEQQGAQASRQQRQQSGQGQQSGQSGQGQQGGQNGQGAQGGDGSADGRGFADGALGGNRDGLGAWNGGYGYGYDRWGRLTPEDIRQLRGELRQWTNELQDLRRMLRGENIDPRQLDEILRSLRQLQDDRVYQDVSELARLQSFITEGLKRFEFGLRRQVDASADAVVLSGSDEVPEEFRKLVEQYYRSLSGPTR